MKQLALVTAFGLAAAVNAQANTITFDFNDGTMQGWVNTMVSTYEVVGETTYGDLSFGAVSTVGSGGRQQNGNFLGEILPDYTGHHKTICVESPQFTLDGSGDLTFEVDGCMGGDETSTYTLPNPLPPLTLPGWFTNSVTAIGLRRDDGMFVLTKVPHDYNNSFITHTWTAAELQPFVNDGHAYTLAMIDTLAGGPSWIALDDVQIPGQIVTTPSQPKGLTLNAAFKSDRSGMVLSWTPTDSGQSSNAFSIVLKSEDVSKQLTDWDVVEVKPTGNNSTSIEIPVPTRNTFFKVRLEGDVTMEYPVAMQYGAPIQFEIWQYGSDAAPQKIMDIAPGQQISGDLLPWNGVRYLFRVPVEHDSISCRVNSTTSYDNMSWGPEPISLAGSTSNLYRVSDTTTPTTGKYYIQVEARRGGQIVAKSIMPFEIVRNYTSTPGLTGVGSTNQFLTPMTSGGAVEMQLWQYASASSQRLLCVITNGMRLYTRSLPREGMWLRFKIAAAHNAVNCQGYSSDCLLNIGWADPISYPGTGNLYRYWNPDYGTYPFQSGKYCLAVEGTLQGASVAKSIIQFEIINNDLVPQGTHYTQGRYDLTGRAITYSEPVTLGALNQTPVLVDNDYNFAPQKAYYTVNWERFPPFQLPSRFVTIYGSRRFLDETNYGGPISRGFKAVGGFYGTSENLPIKQRSWFTYPGQLEGQINGWYATNQAKFADLKAWVDHRSPFISETNAFLLGFHCFNSWGAGGYGPFDPGTYGWDEEEMWRTLDIGTYMVLNHPELVPQVLRDLLTTDPTLSSGNSKGMINGEYERAWASFLGNYYKGAKACAAQRGRALKIWHYGSNPPGGALYMWNTQDYAFNPASGKRYCDEVSGLCSWYKVGNKVSFEASEFSRQVDFFQKDFYFHTIFPQTSSLYEKSGENFVLDQAGRRKIRTDVIYETTYTQSLPIGYEDYDTSAVFLKSFIAKGENGLHFLNGAKYYKKHGTFIADKQLIPAMRPGNQETWGNAAQLGSRPVSPYMAEAASIFTFMMGVEGFYLWDGPRDLAALGQGHASPAPTDALGDLEYMVKGMHRVSQFSSLFEGDYSFVRPFCHYEFDNKDHPLIRGIINGRNIVLAMTNPYLDPGESQQVELWYDAPYSQKSAIWSGSATLLARKTQLFQCQLPALPNGAQYDPDKLYFRYTCVDGNYTKTYTVSGNYNVNYPY